MLNGFSEGAKAKLCLRFFLCSTVKCNAEREWYVLLPLNMKQEKIVQIFKLTASVKMFSVNSLHPKLWSGFSPSLPWRLVPTTNHKFWFTKCFSARQFAKKKDFSVYPWKWQKPKSLRDYFTSVSRETSRKIPKANLKRVPTTPDEA